MPVVVFCQRLNANIRAVVKRFANHGRRESRITHVNAIFLFLRDIAYSPNVAQTDSGIARSFGKNHSGVGAHRSFDDFWVAEVDKAEFNSKFGEQDSRATVCSAVRAVGDHNVVAGFQVGVHHCVRRCHSSPENSSSEPILNNRHFSFVCVDCWVSGTRV